ncbi:MAG TPA: ABC transporter permease [Polyangiales bacterium]|nr:ABC transporter permease [Polyangiales bacterium]
MSTLLFARHELLALRRDPRAWAAAVCLFVLLAAALASSTQMQRAYERTREDAQQASRRTWLGQGSKNAHSAAHRGVYAFRPLPELAPFEPGLHGVLGTTVWLEAHKANDLRDAPDEDGSRLTYLDGSAAFLARTVLPLLVFLLVASSIAGERERGTLKMLLAQGASVARITLGKLLAFGALLLVLIGLAALSSIVLTGSVTRIVGLAAGYTLFALVALFIAMAVSIGASDSRKALVILFAVWTAGTMEPKHDPIRVVPATP